jgi:hypothetical protein
MAVERRDDATGGWGTAMSVVGLLMTWVLVSFVASLLMGRWLATRDHAAAFLGHQLLHRAPQDAQRALITH